MAAVHAIVTVFPVSGFHFSIYKCTELFFYAYNAGLLFGSGKDKIKSGFRQRRLCGCSAWERGCQHGCKNRTWNTGFWKNHRG
jgi:hypothetical protein